LENNLCGNRGVWLFHQVPKKLLISSAGVFSKHFRLLLLHVGGFLPHLILDGVLATVVLGLTARLQVDLVDVPIIEIVAKKNKPY
jgi:hypothetical protein